MRLPLRPAASATVLLLLDGCVRPACPACAPVASEPRAEAVRAAVRRAVGYERMRALPAGFEVVETDTAGRDTVVWRFGPAGGGRGPGRFGPAGELLRTAPGAPWPDLGFDGRYAWQVSSRNPGVADPLSLRNREKLLTPPWVRGGWWLSPRAPFRLAVVDSLSDASRTVLSLRTPGGVVGSTVFVDRRTSLPAALVVEYERGPNRFVFEDYREALGFRIPFRVTSTYAGSTSVRRVVEVRPVAAPAAEAFAVPPLPADHAFDPTRPGPPRSPWPARRPTPTARRGTCSCGRGWTGATRDGGTSTAAPRR